MSNCTHDAAEYNPEHDNFYCIHCKAGMGPAFYVVGKENMALTKENDSLRIETKRLSEELNWQNHRNAGHSTKGGFEFYINEEWIGLAPAAIDANYGWCCALRKHRIDPDDERVRIRRVIEDDAILKELLSVTQERDALALPRPYDAYWSKHSLKLEKELKECQSTIDTLSELMKSGENRGEAKATESIQMRLRDAMLKLLPRKTGLRQDIYNLIFPETPK